MSTEDPAPMIKWLEEIGIGDVATVGGKTASLGELYRALTPRGIRVPEAFAVTAHAYRAFLRASELDRRIPELMAGLDVSDLANLRERGQRVRDAILAAPLPDELAAAIAAAYGRLVPASAPSGDVAVRSSATAEDLPQASFAGQQETYLNIRGAAAVVEATRKCFASLFTDRAIVYREQQGFGHLDVALTVAVQRMVRSDLGAAGVMFSIDTESGFPGVVLINAAWGLGENVVQGSVNPDEFVVFKPTLALGFRAILRRTLGEKEHRLVYDEGGERTVRNECVPPEDRARFALDDDDVLQLARWACWIEDHYSSGYGRTTPMDIEWAKDGRTGELFILQARPETVHARRRADMLETYRLQERGTALARGRSIGSRIASGPARVVRSPADMELVHEGDVLVAERTDPDWEPVMKKVAAVVTDRGGRTCHAAIVSRELGLPAIVGAGDATRKVPEGAMVTVCCAEGEVGTVYAGRLAYDVARVDLSALPRPRTRVMLNVGEPEEAFGLSFLPNDGVGLARVEFIINGAIGIHPLALLEFDRLDAEVKAKIELMTAGHADKAQFFVDRLAEGVGTIAAAFYPKDVIVRMSDFKTNEYANLVGGARYEPLEENPMIGFRGASRYYDPRYRDGFALECRAMKKVREEMGLSNVKLMIPFCRTPEEGRKVLCEMANHGLARGVRGLEIYVMCEIPSNVILADRFADVFDGFSIGSNDLTQLVLGMDRDSEIVAHVFDERDEAVKQMIASVIRTAKARGRKIGICGQAPSDHPEFARFLVDLGIDSISLNPDAVMATTLRIVEAERELAAQPPGPAPAPQPLTATTAAAGASVR